MNNTSSWMRLLGSFMSVLIFSFVFGFILWSVQLRVLKVASGDSSVHYVLVLLTDVERDSDVVFQYPHAESPMYLGHILEFTENKGFLLKTDQGVHLPRELILGKVLYQF